MGLKRNSLREEKEFIEDIYDEMVKETQDRSGRKRYSCIKCGKEYYTKLKMMSHAAKCYLGLKANRVQGKSKRSEKCNICSFRATTKVAMATHWKADHGELGGRMRCTKCLKKFATVQGLKRHAKIHMKKQRLFRCKYCHKTFHRSDNKRRHAQVHLHQQAGLAVLGQMQEGQEQQGQDHHGQELQEDGQQVQGDQGQSDQGQGVQGQGDQGQGHQGQGHQRQEHQELSQYETIRLANIQERQEAWLEYVKDHNLSPIVPRLSLAGVRV